MNTKKVDASRAVRGNSTRGAKLDKPAAKPGPKGNKGGDVVGAGAEKAFLGTEVVGGDDASPRPTGGARLGLGKVSGSPRPGGSGMVRSAPSSAKGPGNPKPQGKKERFSTDMSSMSPQAKQALIDLQIRKLQEKESQECTPVSKEGTRKSPPSSGMKGITPISDEKTDQAPAKDNIRKGSMKALTEWLDDVDALREEEIQEQQEEEARDMGRSSQATSMAVTGSQTPGLQNQTPGSFRTPISQTRPTPNLGTGSAKRARPGSAARRRQRARLAKEAGMNTPGSEMGSPMDTRNEMGGVSTPRGAGEVSGATGSTWRQSLGRGVPPSRSHGRGKPGPVLRVDTQQQTVNKESNIQVRAGENTNAGGGSTTGRVTWSQVAMGALVAELSRVDKDDCKQEDLDLLFDRLNRMICVASKPKPFIRRLSLTRGGKLRVACDDERTLKWLQENVSEIVREEGKGYKFTPPGETTILYTMRIRQESWVRDPSFIQELLLEMNDPLKDMNVKMEGELYAFDKERGGAVLKISMLEKAMDFLKSVDFRPRLGVGLVTLWGPGHRYRREERMETDQHTQGSQATEGTKGQDQTGTQGMDMQDKNRDMEKEEEEMNQGISNLLVTASVELAQDE